MGRTPFSNRVTDALRSEAAVRPQRCSQIARQKTTFDCGPALRSHLSRQKCRACVLIYRLTLQLFAITTTKGFGRSGGRSWSDVSESPRWEPFNKWTEYDRAVPERQVRKGVANAQSAALQRRGDGM